MRKRPVSAMALFAVVFLALYGPKIGGIVDVSILGSALALLLLSRHGVRRPTGPLVTFLLLVTAAVWYTLAVVLFTGPDDPTFALRSVRALVATVILGVVFYNLASRELVPARMLINVMIAVLLVNAAFVFLGIVQPGVQSSLADLYGFNKSIRSFRSFGLTAGYDSAGFLCTFGAALAGSALYYFGRSNGVNAWYLTSLIVFGAASIFTSRTAMILTGATLVVISVALLRSGNRRLVVSASGLLVAVGVASFFYVLPLVFSTISVLQPAAKFVPASDLTTYISNFAESDPEAWRSAMWFLPGSDVELLFGGGADPGNSDVGYVILIAGVGVVGILLTIAPVARALYDVRRLNHQWRYRPPTNPDTSAAGLALISFATFLLVMLFTINIKNLYFLTRGYHELIVITVSFLFGLGFLLGREQVGKQTKIGSNSQSSTHRGSSVQLWP